MSQDSADVERHTHATDTAIVEADRWVRFHWGNESIDETKTDPDWWDDARDASRGTDTQAWIDAVDLVKADVGFDWDDHPNEWKNALRKCFRD